jgi:2-C-methyl-D-erythritol 4-phosphate cytidylyltransferase
MANFCVIIAAAGKSSRFKDLHFKKPFAILNGKAVWLYSAELFLKRSDVKQVIIVLAKEDQEEFAAKFGANIAIHGIDIVSGGSARSDSVQNALAKVRADIDYIAIHDAARPCIDETLIDGVFEAGVEHGAAIPTVPVFSTLKKSTDGKMVDETVDRSHLYLAQTPQVFAKDQLLDMYGRRGDLQPTDEAQLAESLGYEVAMVSGSPLNIKITKRDDLDLAKVFMAALPKRQFDAPPHPFRDGDNLWR